MKGLPEERAVMLGIYIIEHNATVRRAAKEFNISKSTVHKDVFIRNGSLPDLVKKTPPLPNILWEQKRRF